jgi:tetratricopeptide (TPR) repeat protein
LSRLVDTGSYQEAVQLGNGLLGADLDAALEAEVRFSLGRALVRMLEGAAALEQLSHARLIFEQLGDSLMTVHVMEQTTNAMLLAGDPAALSTTLEALERCARLEPPAPTLEASLLHHLGTIHMRSRDWRNAARFFEMGLAVPVEFVSLASRARFHDGLTAAYQYLGDFTGARQAAQRAYALYAVDADATALIRAENNLGYVLLRQDDPAAAAPHLHRALALCKEHNAPPLLRAYALNSLGELHIALGAPEAACAYLLRSLAASDGLGERGPEATARQLLGTACAQLGRDEAADQWFRSAIELLGQLELAERLRDCAAEYAEVLAARGQLDESIRYWRIAATALARSPAESAGLSHLHD